LACFGGGDNICEAFGYNPSSFFGTQKFIGLVMGL